MPMSMQPAQMHEGYVPEYQRSATPYVTGTMITSGVIDSYRFNFVSRFINVKNRGTNVSDSIGIAFTENGFGSNNYFTLDQGESFRDEFRCTQLFVSGVAGVGVNYELIIGLTAIPYKNFLPITGSNGYQAVG